MFVIIPMIRSLSAAAVFSIALAKAEPKAEPLGYEAGPHVHALKFLNVGLAEEGKQRFET